MLRAVKKHPTIITPVFKNVHLQADGTSAAASGVPSTGAAATGSRCFTALSAAGDEGQPVPPPLRSKVLNDPTCRETIPGLALLRCRAQKLRANVCS